jgi:GTPase KRas protein
MVDGKPSMIEVLDSVGDMEYVALREHWIKSCDGVLLVYCINSRASFGKIQNYHHEICAIKGVGNTHICLVGNKSDLGTEREVSTQEGDSLAQSLGCEFMETSAMNIPGLEKAFFNVVRQVQKFRKNTVVVPKVGAVGEQVDLPGGGQSTHRRKSSLSFFTMFFQRSKGPKK